VTAPRHQKNLGRRGLVPASVLALGAVVAVSVSAVRVTGFDRAVLAEHRDPVSLLASDDASLRLKGAEMLVARGTDTWPDDRRELFLLAVAPLAVSSAAEHCLPPSVTIAQAILESGWGTSQKARELRNLFGRKAEEGEGVRSTTWEVVNGRTVDTVAHFRSYDTWAESLADHDAHLASDPLYARARASRHDADAFARALAPIYATDPGYAKRLGSLIDTYDLDAFDAPARAAAEERGACGDAGTPDR
jgi:flagellum-specific peptidoglycan hydrolase FlgJ